MADCASMATGPCQRRTRPRRSVCRYCVCFFLLPVKNLQRLLHGFIAECSKEKYKNFVSSIGYSSVAAVVLFPSCR
ncbi:hypothetical protein E1A91_A05G322600v1 [Gossypium mustelinum]|uniref:Uncharacterized protein n=1 Tax=Gossypium mustelinum TaxID=34275 RepID=A0A5D2ZC66_GOSMU|nr:hypothetical protein E1A91_A05G322600v1 [Gossypium mustelinum]